MKGTIKKLSDKGFGFISIVDDGSGQKKDVFFHANDLVNLKFNALIELSKQKENLEVEFEMGDSPKGPKAVKVQVVDAAAEGMEMDMAA